MRLFRRDRDPDAAPVSRAASIVPPRPLATAAPEALPTVYACLSLISHTATQARIVVERGGTATDRPEWLRRPETLNGGQRMRPMIEGAVLDQARDGLCAWQATPVGSLSWRLDPRPAHRVAVRFREDHSRQWSVDGSDVVLADPLRRTAGLLPVGFLTLPNVARPLGPLQAARYLIDGYADTEAYARNVFRGGQAFSKWLETDADIPQETAARWADAWAERHSDPYDPRVPVLGAGLRPASDAIDPAAAAWIDARQWNAQDVARLLGVPGRRVGLPSGDSRTYATAVDDDTAFIRSTMTAYTDPIADAFTYLLPAGRNETEDLTVRFEWAALLTPTPAEQVTYLSAAVAAGLITLDEARAEMGRDPLDTPTVPDTVPTELQVTA